MPLRTIWASPVRRSTTRRGPRTSRRRGESGARRCGGSPSSTLGEPVTPRGAKHRRARMARVTSRLAATPNDDPVGTAGRSTGLPGTDPRPGGGVRESARRDGLIPPVVRSPASGRLVPAPGEQGLTEQRADHRREVAACLRRCQLPDPGEAFGGEPDTDECAASAWSGHVFNTTGEPVGVLNTSPERAPAMSTPPGSRPGAHRQRHGRSGSARSAVSVAGPSSSAGSIAAS